LSGNIQTETSLEKYEDAFGRIRISEQFTIADYKHSYYDDFSYINISENGGSVTYNQNESTVYLNVSSVPNSSAIHQTRIYHHYQPGKSQFIKCSFVFGSPSVGVTKRTGLFDEDEGIFLEMDESGVVSWNLRNIVTGTSQLATRVTQENWIDPLDRSGPSGVLLDFTKSQLLFIDFQWLGVGRVRCGFIHDGRALLTTNIYHSNVIATPYLRNPSLPIRCEITGTGESAGSMKQICSTVVSEGGISDTGYDFNITSGHLGRDCDVGGTLYPILAIRLKNTFKGLKNRVSVSVMSLTTYVETATSIWQLWRLPSASSLTGTVVWNDVNSTDSAVEYSIHPTAINTTGAILVSSGYNQAGNSSGGNNSIMMPSPTKSKRVTIHQNINSTDSEVFVIVAVPVGTGTNLNSNVFASIQWREFY
jgi:hypothetical protein